MTPESQKDLDESLIWAVENDHLVDARRLLSQGASPNSFSERHGLPVIWLVKVDSGVYHNHNKMLDVLLDAGANPFVRNPKNGNTLLHAAAILGTAGAAFQLMLAGIDPEAENNDGRTPLQLALASGHEDLLMTFAEAINAPRVAIDETLTKDALLQHDGGGRSPLGNPVIMVQFDHVVAQLEANGEPPFTKADLMRPINNMSDSISYLGKASHTHVIGDVIRYLDTRDESLTPQDLVDGNYPLVKSMVDRRQMKELFCNERWIGKRPSELQGYIQALPPEAQAAIPNRQQLMLALQRDRNLKAQSESR